MIPFLKGKNWKFVALCMDDSDMPGSTEDIAASARSLIKELEAIGTKQDDIYVDPLV